MQGSCRIAGVDYELRAWRRNDQLTLAVAPPRRDQNTYPPDVMRGSLDSVAKPSGRGRAKDDEPVPAWRGDIVGEDFAYDVQGFPKQGKSGTYFTLSFAPIAKPPPPPAFVASDDASESDDEDDDDAGES